MVTEEGLTLDGRHTMQYTDDVSQNCIHETYRLLLTNVTPLNKREKKLVLIKGVKLYIVACAYKIIILCI